MVQSTESKNVEAVNEFEEKGTNFIFNCTFAKNFEEPNPIPITQKSNVIIPDKN